MQSISESILQESTSSLVYSATQLGRYLNSQRNNAEIHCDFFYPLIGVILSPVKLSWCFEIWAFKFGSTSY